MGNGPTGQVVSLAKLSASDPLLRFKLLIRLPIAGELKQWLTDAITRYESHEVETLDDAFRIHRKPNPRMRAKLKPGPLGHTCQFDLYLQVISTRFQLSRQRARQKTAHRKTKPVDVFKLVALQYHISPPTARQWYYEQVRLLSKKYR